MVQRSGGIGWLWVVAIALVLGGCVEHVVEDEVDVEAAGATTPEPQAPAPEAASDEQLAQLGGGPLEVATVPTRPPLVVHEWGTFTSLQGSDGALIEGLHHTEEQLPRFVHGRDAMARSQKSFERLPEPVTQKLETPVIYFYSDDPLSMKVEVDFPQGVISEWYPAATSFAPEIRQLERLAQGTMTWDVELVPGPVELLEVPPEDVWAPSRKVPEATPVAVGSERERFIFYRGLGRFEVPFTVTQPEPDGALQLTNGSEHDIPAAFLFHVVDGRGALVPLGAIGAGESISAQPGPKELPLDAAIDLAATELVAALVESGLYPDEARAMVDTWRTSYFGTPGVRVLYVVPQAWTEALLPMRLEPVPDELVRVLVGRVEVLTASEEQELLRRVDQAVAAGDPLLTIDLGRFAEPRLRRVMALSDDPQIDAWCAERIAELQ